MDFSSFLSLIQMIIILIIVIFIANISLKFVNKNMVKDNKIINIIEKVALSNTSSLGVVDICGEYYLMSFTEKDNKILKNLDKNEVKNILKEMEQNKDFSLNGNSIKEILGDKFKDIFGMRDKIE